ncbi:MAG TPA: hypothetical protein PKE69_18540 [Pyrinomonadaceae bacterium]|nr:hypothetical protein [Pyrinomonadaceae bacterium]
MMKTEKELAFIRELTIENDWTQRFTDFFDKKFKFDKEETILYVNAGTGNHAIALDEKLDDKTEIYAVSENAELRNIAQAKADAIKADVRFGTNFPDEKSSLVIADASFVRPAELNDFIAQIIDASKNQIAFFTPTKSSFGEIFSFLWETLLEVDLIEHSANVERLIEEIPTVEAIENLLKTFGLTKIESATETELFEFKDGAEFIESPLIADFLLPVWLDFLTDAEKEKAAEKLAELIDTDDGSLSFRFSVKNTLFSGDLK